MAVTPLDPKYPTTSYILHGNLMALSFTEPDLWAIKVYIAGIESFYLFRSCDLDLDPMTFIYELDAYSLQIQWMCKYELPTSKLSNVVIRRAYRQTERQATRGHFRSCDKHGGHTIGSAIPENPIYTQT